jgi:hypothetical protein
MAGDNALMNLAPNSSFENPMQDTTGWYPIGIVVEDTQPLKIVDGVSHTGKCCMLYES